MGFFLLGKYNNYRFYQRISKVYQLISTQLTILKNEYFLDDRADLANPIGEFSIVVSSCDKYSALWRPFFIQLFKYWPGLRGTKKFIPVYLISNFKKYNDNRVINIRVGEDKGWSDNMIKAAALVKTKYVLILLDDYILTGAVNEKRLLDLINLMYKKRAAYSILTVDNNLFDKKLEKRKKYVSGMDGVIVRSLNSPYRNSLQACVWDTAEFKRSLQPGETAWQYETLGNIRTQSMAAPFYSLTTIPVFQHLNAVAAGKSITKATIRYIRSQGIEFQPVNFVVTNE